jgi:immune inhibitor A
MKAKWFSTLLVVMMLVVAVVPTVGAAPAAAPMSDDNIPVQGGNTDNMGSPLANKQADLRQKALASRLNGQGEGNIQAVGNGQFIELEVERTDKIFVVIAEFGNTRHVSFCDPGQTCAFPPDGSAQTYNGPLHNNIAKPNRSVDNSTLWLKDYNRTHYQDMYFNRMAAYYQSQSSGRYTVDGAVTEWVKVPFNEARYGRDFCGGIVCNNTWFLVRDAMSFWVKSQLDAGWTMQQVTDYLKTFDVWDRYDYDGDGDFDEPDGYIDHFQIVHAGGDQAAGDPHQGTDAIWSHRWYAQLIPIGGGGPVVGGNVVPFGGFNAGSGGTSSNPPVAIPNNPTGVWVGDYTVQPENGGLGVFAHEFGHDAFGLPDLYDTSGNTCGSTCENSTGFWTLMSSGANIGDGGSKGIGDAPTDMGAWEKLQIGWLNYAEVDAGEEAHLTLGPAEYNTKNPQALLVHLPDKVVDFHVGDPFEGSYFYHSGSGNDLDNNMTRPITLGAAPVTLSFQANYHIEACWDYAYVEVSTDGGTTFNPIATSASTDNNENGQNFGHGITGTSGTPTVCDQFGTPVWVPVTADLSAYAGQTIQLRFRYWTDGAVVGDGFGVDNIAITGLPTDGAETDPGWTYEGFSRTTGTTTVSFFNAYIAEYRQYLKYDKSLRTAYNFGFLNTKPDWVETFPYQDGLLISYWDDSQTDNNTSSHPGEGLILPVDAHPTAMIRGDGGIWRSRMQTYDSTFTLAPTDAITLHWLGLASNHPSQAGVPLFDDSIQYWNPATPAAGVMNPNTGTTIRILSTSGQTMRVVVNDDN